MPEPSDEVAGCHHRATGDGECLKCETFVSLKALDDCQSWRTSHVGICKVELYLQGVDSAKN